MGEEEPVEVGVSHRAVDVVEHVQRGHYVEDRYRGDPVRVIEPESVRDPSAAVVADNSECLVAQLCHHVYDVQSHLALAVIEVASDGAGASDSP